MAGKRNDMKKKEKRDGTKIGTDGKIPRNEET